MHRTTKLLPAFIAAAIASTVAFVSPAHAERRKSPLDGQPAVRHRVLLVKKRFELAPTFETSVNADFRHTVSAGLKAEYHFSDMWSFGAMGYFGTSFNTGLTSRILETLPEDPPGEGDPTPYHDEFEAHLNKMPVHGAVFATWTPWYGKLAAFGKAFVPFDFYFSGGLAMAQLKSNCPTTICTDDNPPGNLDLDPPRFPDNDPNDDPPLNDGTKLGLYVGGGIHVFLTEWIAVDLSFRNYLFQDNPSGLDFDADRLVGDKDDRFLNHLFAGIGVSFMLPQKAVRTP